LEVINKKSTFRYTYTFTTSLSGGRVTWSLALCIYFVDRCLSFCPFSFGYCVVFQSIYGFWLPLWYFQTLLLLNNMFGSYLLMLFVFIYVSWSQKRFSFPVPLDCNSKVFNNTFTEDRKCISRILSDTLFCTYKW
jgi:hypothetical protein